MATIYEEAKLEFIDLFEKISKNPKIDGVLDMVLPNSGEGADYSGWIEGSKKFADDNYGLLKEWVK
jgi:hypothetical protein